MYENIAKLMILILTIGSFAFGLIMITSVSSGEINEIELQEFLAADQTDQHEYLPWYTCGHFSRALVKNASEHNIKIGSIICGDHPVLRGHQNHIMNYYVQNDCIWIIEPQTDQIMRLNDTMYGYYRLYPDGSQVPTYWKHNLATQAIV